VSVDNWFVEFFFEKCNINWYGWLVTLYLFIDLYILFFTLWKLTSKSK
jgi:hypothetical protein